MVAAGAKLRCDTWGSAVSRGCYGPPLRFRGECASYAGAGEFDWETIVYKWDKIDIENWGVEIPQKKNTEILSDLVYDPLYYVPEHLPNMKLEECLDLEKFEAKVKAIDEYDLTKKQKEILKIFAYRFIKIDFESVANYYQFNATEEEKRHWSDCDWFC